VHLELVCERAELQQLRRLRALLDELDRRAHDRQVEVDLLDDPGTANLDDHLAAVGEERAMDLRDRGGCERLGVKPHDRIAEVLAHYSLDLGERKGRHGVHELGELLDVDVGQQVGTRGEQLAELQERRPELSRARRNSTAPSRVAGRLPATPSSRITRTSLRRRATLTTSRARRAPFNRGAITVFFPGLLGAANA